MLLSARTVRTAGLSVELALDVLGELAALLRGQPLERLQGCLLVLLRREALSDRLVLTDSLLG
jgi:hypothetical protein